MTKVLPFPFITTATDFSSNCIQEGNVNFDIDMNDDQEQQTSDIPDIPSQEKPSNLYYMSAACVSMGVQFVWAFEVAYGTPFLLDLGLSKRGTSLVWLAGPLSGLLVQPYIGYMSDKTRVTSYGKRTPYVMFGCLLTVTSLIALSTCEQTWTGVIAIYILDFSVNVIQSSSRCLLMDLPLPEQQVVVSAWSTRASNFGNAFGYLIGLIAWAEYLPWRQVSILCWIAAVVLTVSTIVSIFSLKEWTWTSTDATQNATLFNNEQQEYNLVHESFMPDYASVLSNDTNDDQDDCLYKYCRPLYIYLATWRTLPHYIRQVLYIQFFVWLTWFPLFIYGTQYIIENDPEHNVTSGSKVLFVNSIVSTLTATFITRVRGTLQQKWLFGNLFLFALCWTTLLSQSYFLDKMIIAIAGISWAISIWVPYSYIGTYISRCANEKNQFIGGKLIGISNISIVIPQFLSSIINLTAFSYGLSLPQIFCLGSFGCLVAAMLIRTLPPIDCQDFSM